MEAWLDIFEFPGYSVSNYGRVRNDYSGRVLTMLRNQHGVTHVGMNRDGKQYKRSVPKLVAERFLPHQTLDDFDTPIHLDGDRTNNCADNLAWRPKWFADVYTNQWSRPQARVKSPIRDCVSGEEYEDSRDAARSYGLLERDILDSISNGVKVFPTLQRFEMAI